MIPKKLRPVLQVQGNYASSSYQTNRFMSVAGLGVARVPYYLVEGDLAQKKLVHLYKEYSIAVVSRVSSEGVSGEEE